MEQFSFLSGNTKKKSTIVKREGEESLNMTDFTVFAKALKLWWVKRLCSTDDAPPWKPFRNLCLQVKVVH